MKRLATITAVALLTVVAVALSWWIQGVLIALLTSLAVAASVRPVAGWLEDRRLPHGLALAIVYLAGLLLVALLVYVIGAALLELPGAADRFCVAYDAMTRRWSRGTSTGLGIARVLPTSRALLHEVGNIRSATLALGAVGLTARAMAFIVLLIVTAVLSLHWTGRSTTWTNALPKTVRVTTAARIARLVLGRAGAQLRWALVESALCAASLALFFRVLGLTPWALPAAGAALALRLPFIGPVVAVALVVVVAAAQGPLLMVAAPLVAVTVIVLWRALLAPTLIRSSPEPLLTIATAMVLGTAAGLAGVLFAPAVAAALSAVAGRWTRLRPRPAPPIAELHELDERLAWIRSAAQRADPPVGDDVLRLVDRLYDLAGEAELSLGVRSRAANDLLASRSRDRGLRRNIRARLILPPGQ